MRTFHLGLTVLLLGCPAPAPSGSAPAPQREAPQAAAPAAKPSPEPGASAPRPQAADSQLPPSSRVFTASVEPGAPDLVFGASDGTLWARRPVEGGFETLWSSDGPGSVQAVTVGELGGRRSLFVGRGRARGNMIPFVRVDRVDLGDGKVEPLFREESERADIAQLMMATVEGEEALVVGYFETKHRVALRYLRNDGKVRKGPEQLMATSRIYVDLDGDDTPDEVVGRVYSDDQGSPGDLVARIGERELAIETQEGVRALVSAQLSDDGRPAIYFADGWVSNYGTDARAKLARARLEGDRVVVDRLAESPGEYTLFSLQVATVDGEPKLFAQGSRYLSVLDQDASGARVLRRLLSFENGAGQGALGRGPGGSLVWYWPGEGSTTATTIDLGVTKPVAVAAG